MNRSRLVFLFASSALVLTILSGTLLGAPSRAGEDDSIYKYLSVFTEVLRLVRQAYVDETDLDLLMSGALDGAPDALDPFSMYVPEEAVQSYLAARRLGVTRSGLRLAKERGIAFVVAVQEEGPAAKIGLKQGDIIAEIDGQSTRELPQWKIEERLSGAPGTRVELEVLRAGETKDLVLELSEFEPLVAYLEEFEGVPLLRIAAFSAEAPRRVRELLSGVAGDELLIDVRGVAFGEVETAYEVAKLFADGDLGFLLKRDQKLESYSSQAARSWRGDAAVLVNRGTQGAAEVFAQILRQRGGAKLVGQPTFGFAGRTKVIDLAAGGSLVLTDAFFTGPDGKPLDDSVEPDVVVGVRAGSFKELEQSIEDLILKRALDVLRGGAREVEKKAA
ncbi:MAG TPA: S41 family peptidase [Thermoanaerobaculia bacterium]|nr:S41 family peptidase [Thermoanaerobaculia bacterium]